MISRLVQLLGLLQAGKGHNVGSLAKACEVSRRTIFRDLDVLRQAGVPLLFDGGQGDGLTQARLLQIIAERAGRMAELYNGQTRAGVGD
jgi:predicted DNA-binding transcriptional regulator YafY